MSVPFALVRDLPPEDEQAAKRGKEARSEPSDPLARLWAALGEVEDPEVPISIVDMGLVVALEQQAGTVLLKLTFTAMGCPAMEMILEDVRARLLGVAGVERVELEVVWTPPWTPARMTEEGRETLRMWGMSV